MDDIISTITTSRYAIDYTRLKSLREQTGMNQLDFTKMCNMRMAELALDDPTFRDMVANMIETGKVESTHWRSENIPISVRYKVDRRQVGRLERPRSGHNERLLSIIVSEVLTSELGRNISPLDVYGITRR